jgi:hypothetical protein
MSQRPQTSGPEVHTLTEEELWQVTGGQVTDKDGAIIGGAVSAKVLGAHNAVTGYKRGWKSAVPTLEGGAKGGKGAAIAGGIGVAEGAVAGGLTGGIGVHMERTLSGHQ